MGTSCKDLSPQNSTSAKKARTVLSEKASPGGSADTFRAFLGFLDFAYCSWFVWENVDLTRGSDEVGACLGEVCQIASLRSCNQ